MTTKGYTSIERVEHHTGQTFTDAQRAECSLLIPVAEQWIDDRTHRTWGTTSVVTAEQYSLEAPPWTSGLASSVDVITELGSYPPVSVRLLRRPVASVSAVSVRSRAIGSTPTVLTAGTQYELLDAGRGVLSVAAGYGGWLALVTYTPAVVVPPRVELCATKLCAYWMAPLLTGTGVVTSGGSNAVSYQVGDVRISYGSPTASSIATTAGRGVLGIPDECVALLDGMGALVFA